MKTATSQVKKSKGGYVPEGAERWKRARLNAEAKPHTKAAKLYFKRLETAKSVAGWCDSAYGETAMVYTTNDYTPKKKYTCSTEHAAMLLQLRLGTTDENEIRNLTGIACAEGAAEITVSQTYNGETKYYKVGTLEPLKESVNAKCFVCGEPCTQRYDASTAKIETPEPTPEKITLFITADGGVYHAEDVRRVQVSEDAADLLVSYGPTEIAAWQFACDRGEAL